MGQPTQCDRHDTGDANNAALPPRYGGARDTKVLGKLALGFVIPVTELLEVVCCGTLLLHWDGVSVVQMGRPLRYTLPKIDLWVDTALRYRSGAW